mgnify:CR=1 FL=1
MVGVMNSLKNGDGDRMAFGDQEEAQLIMTPPTAPRVVECGAKKNSGCGGVGMMLTLIAGLGRLVHAIASSRPISPVVVGCTGQDGYATRHSTWGIALKKRCAIYRRTIGNVRNVIGGMNTGTTSLGSLGPTGTG